MTVEEFCSETVALLRLRVAAEADPDTLTRVLERFQNLNVVPRRVIAELGTSEILHIQIDVIGVAESQIALITAKIGQVPCVHWHRV